MNTQKDARSALADNIRRLMENWGLSIKELSEKTGYEEFTIASLMQTKEYYNPRLTAIEAIAKAFELQAWQLLMPDLPMGVYRARAMVDQQEEQ